MMKQKHTSISPLLIVAYIAFISLGLPDGLLGVAWPSISATFDRPLGDLGILLVMATIGFFITSFNSGRLIVRFGIGTIVAVCGLLVATGLFVYATAPAWWMVVTATLLLGMGGGAIDAGVNAYAAAHFSPRHVNWLHACYGFGAMLGPLLMTAILSTGQSWRWGYSIVGVVLVMLAILFAWTRQLWQQDGVSNSGQAAASTARPASTRASLRRPLVWMGIAIFFVYTGLEVTAGQWAFSLFTEGRQIAAVTAGIWVSIYWGSLTLGRLVFGVLVEHFNPATILRWSMLAVVVGALLFWLDILPTLSFLGLALMGFMLAPIFPLLIAQTPTRLGSAHAANAIGFQVAAANIGAASVPGGAGILVRTMGIWVIGPIVSIGALLLFVLYEMMQFATAQRSAEHKPWTIDSG